MLSTVTQRSPSTRASHNVPGGRNMLHISAYSPLYWLCQGSVWLGWTILLGIFFELGWGGCHKRDSWEILRADRRKQPLWGSHTLLICCTDTKQQVGLRLVHLLLDSPPSCLIPGPEEPWLLQDTLVTTVRVNERWHRCQSILVGLQLRLVSSGQLVISLSWLPVWPSSSSTGSRDDSLTDLLSQTPNYIGQVPVINHLYVYTHTHR